jgi:hypothetical protein
MRITLKKIAFVILATALVMAAYSLMQKGEAEPEANATVFYAGAFALRIVDANSTPVQGALVNYSILGNKGGGHSGSDGVLEIQLNESGIISITVRKEGFENQVFSLIPTRGEATVTLETKKHSIASYAEFKHAIVAFTAIGPEGEPVDGEARLLDFESSVELGSCQLEGGACSINGLREGAVVFTVVEAEEYALFDGSGEPKELSGYTAFDLELNYASKSAISEIRCVGPSQEQLECNLTIYSQFDYALSNIESNGTAYFAGEGNGEYYFIAERNGYYLPSPAFKAGGSAQVAFIQEGIELIVLTADDSGIPVQSIIKVNEAGGRAVAAMVESNGEARFELPAGNYLVTAIREGNRKAAEVKLESKSSLLFEFESRPAFVNLNAFDSENNSVNALFTITQEGEIVGGGSKGSFEVSAGTKSSVTAEATGYLRVIDAVRALQENEVESIRFVMKKSGETPKTKVSLSGLFNEEGEAVEELTVGKEYSVKLLLEPAGNDGEAGVFLRVEGDAVITDYPAGEKVESSSFYGKAKGYCEGLLQDNAIAINNGFTWVDSRSSAAIKTLEFKVRVDGTGTIGLHYRGYSIINEKWERDPFDAELGLEADGVKAGCYAKAHYAEFQAIGSEGAPVQEPALPSGNASFWVEGGELKSSVEKISFQADAMFPADAVPFSLEAECELAYAIESGEGTEYCYGIEGGYAWFKSGDYNPACPIKVQGSELESDDSARVIITGACVKDSRVEIQIELKSRSEEAFRVMPKNNGGDNTAALYYLIEWKQVGSRFLQVDEKEFAFGEPGVKALDWGGPGEARVLEGEMEIAVLGYQEKKGFFSGKSSLGERVESCSSADCCSSGWCTPSALEEMVNAFKSEAAVLAARTQFKRGPLEVLAAGSFDFVEVAQCAQGGFEALEAMGFEVIESDCDSSGPAVFELRASSVDGANWSYSARVLKLDGKELCGFMHGEANEIVHTEFASMESIVMLSEESAKAIPVPSFYSDVKGVKAACIVAPGECSLYSGELYSIPAIVPSLQTSIVTCVGEGVCHPVCAPKEERVELVTHDNKLYAIMRFGINALCAPVAPGLQSLLSSAGVPEISSYLSQGLDGLTAEFESQVESPLEYDLDDLGVAGE